MKKRYYVFIIIVLFISYQNVYAGRGCCSHHGGQAYCGSNGMWICNDGTQSPTCACSGRTNNNSKNKSSSTSKNTVSKTIFGCTDKKAINYNSKATKSDGSCKFEKQDIKKEIINFQIIESGDKETGEPSIVIEGQNGEKEITTKIVVDENAKEISRQIINEKVIKQPINQVVEYVKKDTKIEDEGYKYNNNHKKEKNDLNIVPLFIVLALIFNIITSKKYIDKKLIINFINKQESTRKVIMYILYFVFIIPVLYDTVIIGSNIIKEKKKN